MMVATLDLCTGEPVPWTEDLCQEVNSFGGVAGVIVLSPVDFNKRAFLSPAHAEPAQAIGCAMASSFLPMGYEDVTSSHQWFVVEAV
jgi:hypothetical protein